MNKFSGGSFILILISISAMFSACGPNAVLPDATGRLCEPGSLIAGATCTLTGCDANASGVFCSADGRGQECRLLLGRACVTTPGCPLGGMDCTVGYGACQRHGLSSCPAGSTVPSLCGAVAGAPIPEICSDAIDNDCNSVVDDHCPDCVPSGAEICDNIDNNCINGIDEGCDDDEDDYCDASMQVGVSGSVGCPNTPRGNTVGNDCDDYNASRNPGAVETCGDGVDQDCNGVDLVCPPICTVEVCDGVDNDCDGQRDEGVLNACGICGPVPAEISCDGRDNNCDGRIDEGTCCPRLEVCNSVDDDCDGSVDEGGVCTVCTVEVCNGRDDDCDGSIDEGVLNACGTCGAVPTEICGNGIDDDCVGGDLICPPVCVAEVCDGRDNDCDGAIDDGGVCCVPRTEICGDGIDQDCNGVDIVCPPVCTPRLEVCGNGIDEDCNGVDLVCPPVCTPSTEVCDGRDNDCDSYIDEGGVCTPSCTVYAEICNGVDDDCDGSIDEGGVCTPSCTVYAEICNGVDDDCDGSIDEGGVCTPSCVPSTEVCDSRDNDCDGYIDEGGVCSLSCGGALVGTEICVSYGFDMPPLATYGGATVVRADITIYGCDDGPRTIRIDGTTREACLPLNASCRGWLATTYSEGAYSDINNVGSWSAPDGTSYLGYNASDSRLSGTLTSVSQIRVWARRSGGDRELTNRSWIARDPSGAVVPSYARTHVGERVNRLMVPVREDCTLSSVRPPDRY